MILLVLGVAFAHHPDASARLGSGVGGGPAVLAPEDAVGLDLSLGTAMSRFTRLQQGWKDTGEGSDVTVWTTQPSARLWVARGVFVSANVPIATVSSAGTTRTGVGDLGASIGIARAVSRIDAWAEVRATAPTGNAGMDGAVEVLDIDTSGDLQIRTKDIRTQQGLGAWGLGVAGGGALRRGDWAVHTRASVRTPLSRTADGIRWGWDVSAGVGTLRSLGPVDLGVFADAWTHTPDRFFTDDLLTLQANRRHGLGVRPTASVAVIPTVRVGAQVHIPVWQWVAGTQLTQGVSGAVRATVRL